MFSASVFGEITFVTLTKPYSYINCILTLTAPISGFGEITPATRLGKLVTLLYSLFGIILFIMFMAVFRVFLIAALNKVLPITCTYCCS